MGSTPVQYCTKLCQSAEYLFQFYNFILFVSLVLNIHIFLSKIVLDFFSPNLFCSKFDQAISVSDFFHPRQTIDQSKQGVHSSSIHQRPSINAVFSSNLFQLDNSKLQRPFFLTRFMLHHQKRPFSTLLL